jgi:hypothetical protein
LDKRSIHFTQDGKQFHQDGSRVKRGDADITTEIALSQKGYQDRVAERRGGQSTGMCPMQHADKLLDSNSTGMVLNEKIEAKPFTRTQALEDEATTQDAEFRLLLMQQTEQIQLLVSKVEELEQKDVQCNERIDNLEQLIDERFAQQRHIIDEMYEIGRVRAEALQRNLTGQLAKKADRAQLSELMTWTKDQIADMHDYIAEVAVKLPHPQLVTVSTVRQKVVKGSSLFAQAERFGRNLHAKMKSECFQVVTLHFICPATGAKWKHESLELKQWVRVCIAAAQLGLAVFEVVTGHASSLEDLAQSTMDIVAQIQQNASPKVLLGGVRASFEAAQAVISSKNAAKQCWKDEMSSGATGKTIALARELKKLQRESAKVDKTDPIDVSQLTRDPLLKSKERDQLLEQLEQRDKDTDKTFLDTFQYDAYSRLWVSKTIDLKAEREKEEINRRARNLDAFVNTASSARLLVPMARQKVADARARIARKKVEMAKHEAAEQEEEERRRIAAEKARKEAEEKAGKEAEEKARKEAEEKARKEAEEKARKEAEEKARKEAEEKARKEEEEKAKRIWGR